MEDTSPQREWTLEDLEVQRTQLYAAIQAAQGRYIDPEALRREAGLATEPSGRSLSLRSRYSTPGPPGSAGSPGLAGSRSLSRTRSAVRGPITDRRGLGTLAPYVIPGLLRKASMVPDEQLSTLNTYTSQSFSFDDRSSRPALEQANRPSTSGRLSGIHQKHRKLYR